MTGFASVEAGEGDTRWRWDAKSVNGRGLELRLRSPNGWEAQEAGWRSAASRRFKRGSITLSLTIERAESAAAAVLDEGALIAAVGAVGRAREALQAAEIETAPIAPERLLGLRGVYETEAAGRSAAGGAGGEALAKAVAAALEETLEGLARARAEEGARVAAVLTGLVDEIERLTEEAAVRAGDRVETLREKLRERVAALLGAGAEMEEGRLAQELALIAVKIDVTEEIERLRGHVAAARVLLAAPEPVGRKLDFLAQEFNREANTLCSKAQDPALTETGLALKVMIDQLREQAANVE